MTRHRAVLDLGRTVADEDHVLDPGLPLLSAAVRLAERTAGAQTLRQLTPQGAAALDVDRLVDRLVRHPHLRLIRELLAEPPSDLLGAVLAVESGLHLPTQPRVDGDLRRPTTGPSPRIGSDLSDMRGVGPRHPPPGTAAARRAVALVVQVLVYLPLDRRRRPVQDRKSVV